MKRALVLAVSASMLIAFGTLSKAQVPRGIAGKYAIRTSTGFLLTAENAGGGRSPDAVHTNRRVAGPWETFTIAPAEGDKITLRTAAGTFLTAEGGGTQGLSADRRQAGPWEMFTLTRLEGGYGLETVAGTFITAEGNGGRQGAHAVSTNRQQAGPWETFTLIAEGDPEFLVRMPKRFAIQTGDGFLLTAENAGGGKSPDAVYTNRKVAGPWETFTFAPAGDGQITLRTAAGTFLTAEGGGTQGLSADRRQVGPWEKFTLQKVEGGYALVTVAGTFVTAEGNGGRPGTNAVSTNRTKAGPWETFTLIFRN